MSDFLTNQNGKLNKFCVLNENRTQFMLKDLQLHYANNFNSLKYSQPYWIRYAKRRSAAMLVYVFVLRTSHIRRLSALHSFRLCMNVFILLNSKKSSFLFFIECAKKTSLRRSITSFGFYFFFLQYRTWRNVFFLYHLNLLTYLLNVKTDVNNFNFYVRFKNSRIF